MFDGGSVPRVMETANSNFYSDITWPLPLVPSGQEKTGMFFLFLKKRKKDENLKRRTDFVKLLLVPCCQVYSEECGYFYNYFCYLWFW